MAKKRCLLEMGMGTDLHGKDYTKAAQRAVRDALWHNSVSFPGIFADGANSMYVDVTIAVPEPEQVNGDEVLSVLPYGMKSINVVQGGLNVPSPDGSDVTIIANAAVIVSLEVE
ncbi:MAG: hypothetical protein FI679_05620 [SAR202 cluster bacterium]|jgi:uncharacterized protein (TIGR02058 family)|nr:hypothetical protein [Rhodospirillaceae bacterium]MBR73226.1 hypothetical protein [Rhodospirillaceae bacterium]MCH2522551.1 Lin0512 family protein [Dehalococcoidia bacterium]MQG25116.1 hypothetical protein [SAR202 cluster bacterium]MQG85359.1 hypothetical protein [SAR202 cluster bacterium]|tara:strand:+ start:1965 stop:2306 length:342 start_codon:yes stop_codon:yes gene_type:complete